MENVRGWKKSVKLNTKKFLKDYMYQKQTQFKIRSRSNCHNIKFSCFIRNKANIS